MKFKFLIIILLSVFLCVAIFGFLSFLPILTGMAAKTMCSCRYVMGRDQESVLRKELSVFPGLSSATFSFSQDSSVIASLLWSESKSIYRKGLGCTLLAQRSEAEVRKQKPELAAIPDHHRKELPWPAGDLLPDSAVSGVNYQKVLSAVDSAFIDVDPAEPVYTHAVVVVYDGNLIAEKYAEGFNKDARMIGWSMTKSITNALVGILVKEGRLKLDEPAPVPEWKNDDRKTITINNLLQASSGLEWNESYFLPGDFHNMFILSDDKGGYAARKPLQYKPNTYFEYSSGTANLLSRIIRQTVGDRDYYRFPAERLFYKIGMYGALLEPDPSGTFVGSSYGFATARDWARFGLLFANDGVWLGERILPEGWVKYSSTPAPAATIGEYGAHWWLNAGEPGNPEHCKYPGLPHEAMVADGFEQQHVVVIPSRKLVIVRLGVTHNHNFNFPALVNGVINALPN